MLIYRLDYVLQKYILCGTKSLKNTLLEAAVNGTVNGSGMPTRELDVMEDHVVYEDERFEDEIGGRGTLGCIEFNIAQECEDDSDAMKELKARLREAQQALFDKSNHTMETAKSLERQRKQKKK